MVAVESCSHMADTAQAVLSANGCLGQVQMLAQDVRQLQPGQHHEGIPGLPRKADMLVCEVSEHKPNVDTRAACQILACRDERKEKPRSQLDAVANETARATTNSDDYSTYLTIDRANCCRTWSQCRGSFQWLRSRFPETMNVCFQD